MSPNVKILPDDTLIIWNKHPVGEYRKFFIQTTGMEISPSINFQNWLFSQAGKTLAEALEEYRHPSGHEQIKDFLQERRFNAISKPEKDFIIAFDRAIADFGYDFGNMIGSGNVFSPMVIIYGKTGTKSRPCAARIYINENGIALRLFLNKISAHTKYIENASAHIKEAFSEKGLCTFCWDKCPSRPAPYTIDGRTVQKCQHHTFYFDSPSVDRLPDYMGLFAEFYPKKK